MKWARCGLALHSTTCRLRILCQKDFNMKKKKLSFPAHPLTTLQLSVSTEDSLKSSNYVELSRLGEGGFGTVSRCLKQDTNKIVAVKRLKDRQTNAEKEISMLERLRSFVAHKYNMVRFYESFQKDGYTFLVFEALDISLYDYMRQRDFAPLSLYDIKWIIKQLARAFAVLRLMEVIHTDVKPDNIMLVDHRRKPLRVKLIDFGLAIPVSEAKQGSCLQPIYWRSPEILLGLQFSEAIDMWSLGCVMAQMLLGYLLFPGDSEYDVMRFIVELLGRPDDYLLKAGLRTKLFFELTPFYHWRRCWRLKSPVKYSRDARRYSFRSLVQLKEILADQNKAEADDIRDCVDLIKALLEVNPAWRITPPELLGHPFLLRRIFDRPCRQTRPRPLKLESAEGRSSPQLLVIKDSSPQKTEEALREVTDAMTEGHTDMSLEALGTNEETAVITEETMPLNTTEVGAATSPAVDLGVVSVCAPQSRAAAAPATATNRANSTHTTPDITQPEKKRRGGRVRRFFSRLLRVIQGVNNRVSVV
ncbi:homeodomain-interacting protein kinase 2-like [Myripristis murdjan]|uniref:homeodomain-interacting protein kinase 2-like n=1 Tax=Myripristis murdjan TaxID=586833 RepID=UPI001175FB13|nr:homeodomain-interacting protein kinase 2-like [Myripristis murdjan]